jgi:transposase InsO family protein
MILQLLLAMLAGWLQRHQQQVIMSLQEEKRVLKAQLGGRRLRLTATERRRLAALASPLGRRCLHEVAMLIAPDTLMRCYRQRIARQFDGSRHRTRLGRPPVVEESERLTVQMAEENRTGGCRRIQGALANLGHAIDAITVRHMLRRHHLEPAPQRRKYRDTTFTPSFEALLQGSGVEPIVLPPRSPNLNAHGERFVRSIKEEALDQMVIFGERGRHHVISQYLMHYHTERNHQGLRNVRIAPAPANEVESGRVVRRARLGGLLSDYYRDAA